MRHCTHKREAADSAHLVESKQGDESAQRQTVPDGSHGTAELWSRRDIVGAKMLSDAFYIKIFCSFHNSLLLAACFGCGEAWFLRGRAIEVS